MEITEVFYPVSREEWRAWLDANHRTATEIWLRTFRLNTSRPKMPYEHAVEEALCFGWIDGINKKYDDESTVQRFTPRRAKSFLSELNRQRMFKLILQGKMTPAGLQAVGKQLGKHDDPLVLPDDIRARLEADPLVWENFQRFPLIYQKIRIGFIVESYRGNRAAAEQRLNYLLKMTAQNKMYGTMVEFPE